MGCPAPEKLTAFRAGTLPADEAAEIREHLKDGHVCSATAPDADPQTLVEPTAATVGSPHRARRPSPAVPALGPGATVGRYVVVSELGKGGMGAVYAAYDPQLDRKVALKLLHLTEDAQVSAAEAAARLQREAQALARVSHPNTVAIFDVGTHMGRVFLAMEHLDGKTLRPWLKEKAHPWREVVRVCLDAGKGLAAVHAAGLVHRDFKPANVIVTDQGVVKVLDFGLARLSVETSGPSGVRPAIDFSDMDFDFPSGALETPLTAEGSLSGTPGYIAPELMLGEPASAASDQFAFGVTLHLALYGERPFGGGTFEEMRAALARGLPPAPPANAQAPRWLYEVVRRCLAARPAERFPSMKEAMDALGRDPARVWRRWAVRGAAVVAVGLAALVSARLARVDCPTEEEFQQSLWSKATREHLSTSLLRAGPSATASVGRALATIDERTGAWAKQSAGACVAAAGHKAARLDVQRVICLRRRGEGIRILVEALSRGDQEVAAHADELSASFLRITGCVQEAELERLGVDEVAAENSTSAVELRAGLLHSRALALANHLPEALAEAQQVVARARDAGMVGFESEALQVTAGLDRGPGREAEAIAALEGALQQAIAAGTDGRAFFIAEALSAWYVRERGHLPEARLTLRLMEGLWVRLGRAEDLELSLLKTRDKLAEAEGRTEDVGRDAARSYELAQRVYGPKSIEAAEAADHLAVRLWAEGKVQESNRLDEHALHLLEAIKGPDDPSLEPYFTNVAQGWQQEGRAKEAIALLDRGLASAQRAHPDGGADTASMEIQLSELLHGVDDVRALAVADAALAHLVGSDDLEAQVNALEARADALVVLGRAEEATKACQRAAELVPQLGDADEEAMRDARMCTGMALAASGDHRAALKEYEKAAATGKPSEFPTVRARLSLELARELRANHGDEARVRELAQDALRALSRAEGFAAERAKVQQFLAEPPPPPPPAPKPPGKKPARR